MLFQERDEEGEISETQVWASEEAARRFVDVELAPALEGLGVDPAQAAVLTFREIKRLAIDSNALAPGRFDAL
ncbi:MAG: hypothetical protein WAO61_09775 [Solirubrobacterales bacterium]